MKQNYLAVLLEEVRDQNRLIMENLGTLLGLPAKVDRLEIDMSQVRTDIKIIKGVLIDTNRQVNNHEERISRLEAISS